MILEFSCFSLSCEKLPWCKTTVGFQQSLSKSCKIKMTWHVSIHCLVGGELCGEMHHYNIIDEIGLGSYAGQETSKI